MKYSKYNFLRKINNKFYIVNLLSSEYHNLTEEQYDLIKSKSLVGGELLEKLKNSNMVLDDDIDEVSYLKDRYKKTQTDKDLLTITIAPTLRCNFACPYCYENKNGKIID